MSMTEITDPLIDAWKGGDVELLEALEYIAAHVERIAFDALYVAAEKHVDNIEELDDLLMDDIHRHGAPNVAEAFRTAHKEKFDELLEAGRCPACGGSLSTDGGHDGSVWCSACGKDWT